MVKANHKFLKLVFTIDPFKPIKKQKNIEVKNGFRTHGAFTCYRKCPVSHF